MNDEEKKAIDKIKIDMSKPLACKDITLCDVDDLIKMLNLIEKQEKEIKQLKEDISNMYDKKVVRNILEDECGLSKYEIDEILN